MTMQLLVRFCTALWVLVISAPSTQSSAHLERQRLEFSKLTKDADDAVHNGRNDDAIRRGSRSAQLPRPPASVERC